MDEISQPCNQKGNDGLHGDPELGQLRLGSVKGELEAGDRGIE